jgi:hypothetical protein
MWTNTDFLAGGSGVAGESFMGAGTYGEVAQLIKSLTAGSDTSIAEAAASGNTTGFALRPQSLERALTLTTYSDKHIVMWKQIPKEGAKSTVEEYNTLDSYGDEWMSAFTIEGELPGSEDSVYARNLARVKFMGTLRSVTDPFGMVANANGDPIANETTNGLRWLGRQIERHLFFGDSSANPVEFDGFKRMMELGGSEVIDARDTASGANIGGVLSKDILDDIADKINNTYFGDVSELHYGTAAHKRFGKALGVDPETGSTISRLDVKAIGGGDLVPGFRLGQIATFFGDIKLKPNLFLNTPGKTANELTSARFAKANMLASGPAAPAIDTQPTSATDGAGQWGTVASLFYRYAIVALSPRGNSIATITNEVAVGGATYKVTVGFSAGSGGGSAPTGFAILRTKPYASGGYAAGTNLFYEVGRVAAAGVDGADEVSYVDRNQIIAGTGFGFAITTSDNTYSWKQLAPVMKIPLAKIDLRTRWAQVIYGTPVLRAPKKWILIKNLLQN